MAKLQKWSASKMKVLGAILAMALLAQIVNVVGDIAQNEQIEQLQLKIEELDEHIFILQGDDYNETY